MAQQRLNAIPIRMETKNTSVEHYKVLDGGHVWFDIGYDGANTSALIWNFVSRYENQWTEVISRGPGDSSNGS